MKTLKDLFMKYGTGKYYPHRYDRYYSIFLDKLKNKKFTLCEIGVDEGASLAAWRDYFPKANIIGVDCDTQRCTYLKPSKRIKLVHGSQSTMQGINNIIEDIGKCDVIIDDGSHHPVHMFNTFINLFDKSLNYGGIYIIEDIECHYWRESAKVYNYTIGTEKPLFDFIPKTIDMINHHFSRDKNKLNLATLTIAHNCLIITKKTEEDIELYKGKYIYRKFQ